MTQILSDAEYIISDVSVTNTTPNFYTESINYIGNALSRGLHRLEVELTVNLTNEQDIRRFNAFMLNNKGRLNPFKLSLLDDTDGKGNCNPFYYDAAPMLANDIKIGNDRMILSGISNAIPAGTMFQFPNDTKVYTFLDDVSNNKTVRFFPATRLQQPIKARLKLSVEPLLRLTSDDYQMKFSNGHQEIKIKASEVL
ncbi:hypothetical protein [Photobacterium damselae]|uniref:hypothetical protein n=1 Tax=Photobacterium damselae TaxID=38293 RepID=UPI00165DDFFD|nr:hypothetical protein [Photobacterium damselae]